MWTWDDSLVCAADYETSGTRMEYALQPWRIPRGEAWTTSLAWVWPHGDQLMHGGSVMPTPDITQQFLEWAIAEDRVVCCWNAAFDISVAMALGFRDLCMKIRWLDGMLLWRHASIQPERDDGPKRPYDLKSYVREHMPQHAGYEQDVDFHDASPEALEKLHFYNIQDNVFTLKACKRLWRSLEPRQQSAAWIEAACLPMVADANLQGLLIDTIACQDLMLHLRARADSLMAELGVTEATVRSSKQLGELLFDQWKLPIQKQTATGNRSTDKEVLYELAFVDPRAKKLRDSREALNCSKKFAETPLTAARYNGDDRAHPLARVFGTYSGRFTYSSKQTRKKKGQAIAQETEDTEAA